MTSRHIFVISFIVAVAVTASCRRSAEAPKAEPPALNVTHWTEKTELYME
jgi:hypothetical protein